MTRRGCGDHESCCWPPGKQNVQLPHTAPWYLSRKSSAPGLPFPAVLMFSRPRQLGWPGQAVLWRVAGEEGRAGGRSCIHPTTLQYTGKSPHPLAGWGWCVWLLSSPCQAPQKDDQDHSGGRGCRDALLGESRDLSELPESMKVSSPWHC